jgi:CYTH domain-containing protein
VSEVTDRFPGEGRYAKLERERRWRLDAIPVGVTDEREIIDDYLAGTRLRLRKVLSDGASVFKLCQKVRVVHGDPERVKITNIYISLEEYDRMLSLPSLRIVKTRRNFVHANVVYAIDQFDGRHAGLVLAELEVREPDSISATPEFAKSEVTHDDRYSGGWLAFASDNELRELIAGKGTFQTGEN